MGLPLTNCLLTDRFVPFKGIFAGKLPSTLVTYYLGEVTMVVSFVGLYNVKLITPIGTFFCWILCIHVHIMMKKSLQLYCPYIFQAILFVLSWVPQWMQAYKPSEWAFWIWIARALSVGHRSPQYHISGGSFVSPERVSVPGLLWWDLNWDLGLAPHVSPDDSPHLDFFDSLDFSPGPSFPNFLLSSSNFIVL